MCWCSSLPEERIHIKTSVYILQHPFEVMLQMVIIIGVGMGWCSRSVWDVKLFKNNRNKKSNNKKQQQKTNANVYHTVFIYIHAFIYVV